MFFIIIIIKKHANICDFWTWISLWTELQLVTSALSKMSDVEITEGGARVSSFFWRFRCLRSYKTPFALSRVYLTSYSLTLFAPSQISCFLKYEKWRIEWKRGNFILLHPPSLNIYCSPPTAEWSYICMSYEESDICLWPPPPPTVGQPIFLLRSACFRVAILRFKTKNFANPV